MADVSSSVIFAQDGVPSQILLVIGPILLGMGLSAVLYGIMISQLNSYYTKTNQDHFFIKFTVYALFCVDTFHSVGVVHLAWSFLCSGWGQLNHLRFVTWGFATMPLILSFVAAWVQLFFAWRIWELGRKERILWTAVVCAIFLMVLLQFSTGLATTIRFFLIHGDSTQFSQVFVTASIWLAANAACDVVIAVSLIVLTLRTKKQSSASSNQSLRSKTIELVVATGFVTACSAVLELGLFWGRNSTHIHVFVALSLTKLYTNSLYAYLNGRKALSVERRLTERNVSAGTAIQVLRYNNGGDDFFPESQTRKDQDRAIPMKSLSPQEGYGSNGGDRDSFSSSGKDDQF